MDLQMPGSCGLESTRRIKAELPDVKIVILIAPGDDTQQCEPIGSLISGYLPTCEAGTRLLDIISEVESVSDLPHRQ
jgi:DNA-binding NarL/FixJ family response regulator